MKILLLSLYGYLAASSRYRFYQYLPYLRQQGIEVEVAPLLDDEYIKDLYAGRKKNILNIIKAYGKRINQMLRTKIFDLIWIEKEALPWLPGWVEYDLGLSKVPYVVDYDDAIFHRYDQHKFKLVRILLGRKIDRVMRWAALVVAGNDYLADRARDAGASRIEILPTVIDLEKYCGTPQPINNAFTIGWIGSPATSGYLTLIAPALKEICRQGDARVVLVGAGEVDLPDVPVQYVCWSEATEAEEIQHFDVGIMPLPDEPWERGKCGLKLIQYMACARPVVGSPVGVNRKIIRHGVNGYLARTNDEWLQALLMLRENKEHRQRMGEAGRKLVEKEYSLQVTAPQLMKMLQSVKYEGSL
ncbi:MAG TPA: glycosyltransferase family 4 protein, partial [Candidatus Limnocylindrales bacterium]|nr:glycosyltransferase family 4 protein [Candidatus Limnocylindrales bacterium]